MDPLTHATLGIAVALAVAPRSSPKAAVALVGFAAGTLPDADIFLSSASDPLFSLEYHRHFTHSLLFSPVIALLGVCLAQFVLRCLKLRTAFRPLLLPAWLAALSHLFCDLWTSYGTRIGWPFSDVRSSLDWISVIDPLLTLPLLLLTLLALIKSTPKHARLALAWVSLYLTACVIQHHRAHAALEHWFISQGKGEADRTAVHPSFGNILVWRALAEKEGIVQAIAIRCGLGEPEVLAGESSPVFNHPDQAIAELQLDPDSPQARDVRRFFHFSANWVTRLPTSLDTLGDIRYATLPDSLSPLWGIQICPADTSPPITWKQFRSLDAATWDRFVTFLFGDFTESPEATQQASPKS